MPPGFRPWSIKSGTNVRLFLQFDDGHWGKRVVRRVAGGIVTFGDAPPPITLYAGPTARAKVKEAAAESAAAQSCPHSPVPSGVEGDSSGNVSRGDKI